MLRQRTYSGDLILILIVHTTSRLTWIRRVIDITSFPVLTGPEFAHEAERVVDIAEAELDKVHL
jgi:hypothetical protein